MTVTEAIATIQTINGPNGYAYYPTLVTAEPTDKSQGVRVEPKDGKLRITINADGRCLARIKEAITEKLGGHVMFADEQTPPTKESGNASDETTADNRSEN